MKIYALNNAQVLSKNDLRMKENEGQVETAKEAVVPETEEGTVKVPDSTLKAMTFQANPTSATKRLATAVKDKASTVMNKAKTYSLASIMALSTLTPVLTACKVEYNNKSESHSGIVFDSEQLSTIIALLQKQNDNQISKEDFAKLVAMLTQWQNTQSSQLDQLVSNTESLKSIENMITIICGNSEIAKSVMANWSEKISKGEASWTDFITQLFTYLQSINNTNTAILEEVKKNNETAANAYQLLYEQKSISEDRYNELMTLLYKGYLEVASGNKTQEAFNAEILAQFAEYKSLFSESIQAILNSNKTTQEKLDAINKILKNIECSFAKFVELYKQNSAQEAKDRKQEMAYLKAILYNAQYTNAQLKTMGENQAAYFKSSSAKLDALLQMDSTINASINNGTLALSDKIDAVVNAVNVSKDEIIAALQEMGYSLAEIEKMTAQDIIEAINKNTEEVKLLNWQVGAVSRIIALGLENISTKISVESSEIKALLERIQGGKSSEEDTKLLKQILAEIKGMRSDLNSKLDAIKNSTENIEQNTKDAIAMLKMEYQETVYLTSLAENMNGTLINIETLASGFGMELSELKEYLNKIGVTIEGQSVSLDDLKAALNKINGEQKVQTKILEAIQLASELGLADVLAYLQAILDKIPPECNHDAIIAKLEIIISKMNNNEGVIDDLDDLFAANDAKAESNDNPFDFKNFVAYVNGVMNGTASGKYDNKTYYHNWNQMA